MIKKIFASILIAVLAIALGTGDTLAAREKKAVRNFIKSLDLKYRMWWDHVSYIITPTEKSVFLKLKNNRERESYIRMFWNMRDPSKGTPDNEFKEEHMKRFKYANKYFGYTSPLPGWKTDRGRIYILLGPAVHRNEVQEANGLYPIEIWEYFGGVKMGLPPVFRVVFFKRSGGGDFRLYIPSVDGPAALLRSEVGSDPHDYYKIYHAIKEISHSVAEVALTLIPGEGSINYSPSLQAPILISKIYDLPKKRINSHYARNFLNYKGLVKTSVITNYVNLSSDFYILRDPLLKMNFVHLALRPDQISVDYIAEKDQYYFNLDLMVFIKKGETDIMQYTKKFPFYYTKAELDQRLSHGIIVTDYFPIIDGDFKFIAILQNSLNKELSYYETRINSTPQSPTTSSPQLYGPMVSYNITRAQTPSYAAFNVMDTSIKIDPKKAFGAKDKLYTAFSIDRGSYQKALKVDMRVISTDEKRKYSKTYTLPFDELDRFKTFAPQLDQMPYGNYEVTVTIKDRQGKELVSRANEFQVSPSSVVPHPPQASKTLKRRHNFLFYMMVAQQYMNNKDLLAAELNFQLAFGMNPHFPQLLKSYATLLLQTKKYDKLLDVIVNLEKQEKERFDYYSLRGRALYYLERFEEAADTLLKANKIFDSDVSVLNILGLSFIRLGNEEEAHKALSASLKLNQTQPDIADVLKQLDEQLKKKAKSPEKPGQTPGKNTGKNTGKET